MNSKLLINQSIAKITLLKLLSIKLYCFVHLLFSYTVVGPQRGKFTGVRGFIAFRNTFVFLHNTNMLVNK